MTLSHDAPDPTAPPDLFREVFRQWTAHVALVAVRDDGRVYGTTVTSLTPVAAEPPTVLVSLGPGAQALPFLAPGRPFAVSLLARDQAAVAERFADSYPVGPSPFPERGHPVVAGSLAWLACRVTEVVPAPGGSRLILGQVEEASVDPGRAPLLYGRRRYTGVVDDPR